MLGGVGSWLGYAKYEVKEGVGDVSGVGYRSIFPASKQTLERHTECTQDKDLKTTGPGMQCY